MIVNNFLLFVIYRNILNDVVIKMIDISNNDLNKFSTFLNKIMLYKNNKLIIILKIDMII